MTAPAPRVPTRLNAFARDFLDDLKRLPGAGDVVIGGGVALQHYLPYRDTADLDAWWAERPTAAGRAAAAAAMQRLAAARGAEARARVWGDTESHELVADGDKVFSFQIARRSVALDPSLESAWPPVRIETLRDNLGAKMNALVGRGAPRDLLDIVEACRAGLTTPAVCWELWLAKNAGGDAREARARVLHHLMLIEARRPLASIEPEPERAAAASVRAFVRERLCREGGP